ncbi:MAG TPA: hypothetical protein VFQ77_13250 [Pseudonocardiaceae bacterium]|jgi:hypothetical protein|nr:hypothetical protein [Pseudonocardiaceae bacterium]
MTPRTRWALLAVLLVAFAAAVVVAGQPGEAPPVAGVQRLGPESGELVADYLRRAAGSLPAAGRPEVWALVQLDGYLDPVAAAVLVQGSRLSGVVLRVPLPGVQTALVFRDLPGQHPAAELVAAMRAAGADRARAATQAPPTSRAAAVAAVEAARLRASCACVLALLVRADGAALRELAARPGIRAVQAASPGTPRAGLAISPLLPEQRFVVGPVPDQGPVLDQGPVPPVPSIPPRR